jgi:hypothetical protein
MEKKPVPGVSRSARISDEGLLRLEKQLSSGTRMAQAILRQWVHRYGDEALQLILKYRSDFKM